MDVIQIEKVRSEELEQLSNLGIKTFFEVFASVNTSENMEII